MEDFGLYVENITHAKTTCERVVREYPKAKSHFLSKAKRDLKEKKDEMKAIAVRPLCDGFFNGPLIRSIGILPTSQSADL